ncbi:MAG: hypothetical protein AAF108_09000 [Planctomycetota bacterium]
MAFDRLIPRGFQTAGALSTPGLRHLIDLIGAVTGHIRRAPRASLAAGLASVFLCTSIAFVWSAQLASTPPGWWSAAPIENAATIALDIENTVIGLTYKPADADWPLDLDDHAVNAWISKRLPVWLSHEANTTIFRWPDEIGTVRVAFRDGELLVGIRLTTGDTPPTIYAATLRPTLSESGALWIPARSIQIGSLKLPAGPVLTSAPTKALPKGLRNRPEITALFDALAGRRPIVERADIRLGDGRRVRVEQLAITEGSARLVCRTSTDHGPREPDRLSSPR